MQILQSYLWKDVFVIDGESNQPNNFFAPEIDLPFGFLSIHVAAKINKKNFSLDPIVPAKKS